MSFLFCGTSTKTAVPKTSLASFLIPLSSQPVSRLHLSSSRHHPYYHCASNSNSSFGGCISCPILSAPTAAVFGAVNCCYQPKRQKNFSVATAATNTFRTITTNKRTKKNKLLAIPPTVFYFFHHHSRATMSSSPSFLLNNDSRSSIITPAMTNADSADHCNCSCRCCGDSRRGIGSSISGHGTTTTRETDKIRPHNCSSPSNSTVSGDCRCHLLTSALSSKIDSSGALNSSNMNTSSARNFHSLSVSVKQSAGGILSSASCHYKMSDSNNLVPSEQAKRFAAYACAEAEIRSGLSIGMGSGSTVKYLIDWMYERRENGMLECVVCVPTSFQTKHWLKAAGIFVCSLDDVAELDLAIDGADEVDAQLTCIKGGGGCLLREKIVQTCAKRFILIGGLEKYSDSLGHSYQTCAVEVVPFAISPVQRWISEQLGGTCILRMDQRKCFPTVTENNNYIIDWNFPKPVVPGTNWYKINQMLHNIPGVVETGLFVEVAECGYFASAEGNITKVLPKKRLTKN